MSQSLQDLANTEAIVKLQLNLRFHIQWVQNLDQVFLVNQFNKFQALAVMNQNQILSRMETQSLAKIEDVEFSMKRKQSLYQVQMCTSKIIQKFKNLQQALVLDLANKDHKQAKVMLALPDQEHTKSNN